MFSSTAKIGMVTAVTCLLSVLPSNALEFNKSSANESDLDFCNEVQTVYRALEAPVLSYEFISSLPPTRIEDAESCIKRAELCQNEGNLASATNFFLFASLEPLKSLNFEKAKSYIYRALAREANLSVPDRLNLSNALFSLSKYLSKNSKLSAEKAGDVEILRTLLKKKAIEIATSCIPDSPEIIFQKELLLAQLQAEHSKGGRLSKLQLQQWQAEQQRKTLKEKRAKIEKLVENRNFEEATLELRLLSRKAKNMPSIAQIPELATKIKIANVQNQSSQHDESLKQIETIIDNYRPLRGFRMSEPDAVIASTSLCNAAMAINNLAIRERLHRQAFILGLKGGSYSLTTSYWETLQGFLKSIGKDEQIGILDKLAANYIAITAVSSYPTPNRSFHKDAL